MAKPRRRAIRWVIAAVPWWMWIVAIAIAVGAATDRLRTAAGAAVALVLALFALRVRRRVSRRRVRSWVDAERATAAWLRRRGCRGVRLTSPGADGGVDVVTRQLAVQVKHVAGRVGRPTIQQVVGAAVDLDRAPAVFSTSGFTAPAIDYAEAHRVALFHLHTDGRAAPLNREARRVT